MLPDVFGGSKGLRLMDYCILLACLMWVTSATIMGDECDWTGSGLTTGSSKSRGVTPVYLRCTAGRVTWLYPRGALRVLLRLPGHDRDFRACIKVHPDSGKHMPARLFLEGPRSLLPLFANDDGGGKITRCFNSKNFQAAIYVEASDGESVTKRVADFEYDLQPFPRGSHSFDTNEECRPCTSAELAHAFCTSDLVTRGIIRAVENQEELEVSEMTVKITKMIRETGDDGAIKEIENNIYEDLDSGSEITLNVAKSCGVIHGVGEFVFMARRKLGDLTLQCAPRLEDWAMLIHSLTEEGKAHCVLKS